MYGSDGVQEAFVGLQSGVALADRKGPAYIDEIHFVVRLLSLEVVNGIAGLSCAYTNIQRKRKKTVGIVISMA